MEKREREYARKIISGTDYMGITRNVWFYDLSSSREKMDVAYGRTRQYMLTQFSLGHDMHIYLKQL